MKTDYRNEDGYGYNGMVHSQQWRFLGVRDILSGVGLPTSVPEYGGHNGWYPATPFQLRRAYVVEALAKDPDHHYPRRTFYIDTELWMPVYTVGLDKSGRCFKVVFHLYGDPAHNLWVPDSHAGPINLGGCAIDYSRNHATLLPNTKQQFNGPVEHHPIMQAALAGKAPLDAGLEPREDFQWIAIGHTADVVEVVTGRLYRPGLPSQKVLDDGGIDVVVNLSGRNPTDLQRTAASGRIFVYWPIEDDELPDQAMLDGLCHWLAMLLQTTNKKILVHCVAGVNRSNLVIGRVVHDYLGLGGEPLIQYLEERSEGYAILTNRVFRAHLMRLPNNSNLG